MKTFSTNLAIPLFIALTPLAAQAETIVYNYTISGFLHNEQTATQQPAIVEGTITLSDNPTAKTYTNFSGFMGINEYLSWYWASESPLTFNFTITSDSGEVLAQESAFGTAVNTITYDEPHQTVYIYSSNGVQVYGDINDANYLMPTLSAEPESGQTLSEVLNLFQYTSRFYFYSRICLPGEPYEVFPGVWTTPCDYATFQSESWTFTTNKQVPDADGDGIYDSEPLVLISGMETNVPNYMLLDGETNLSQGIASIIEQSESLNVELSSLIANYLNELKSTGVITGKEKGQLQSAISKSKK